MNDTRVDYGDMSEMACRYNESRCEFKGLVKGIFVGIVIGAGLVICLEEWNEKRKTKKRETKKISKEKLKNSGIKPFEYEKFETD